jgi:hypothetical protein
MNWKGCGRKRLWSKLKYYHGMYLEIREKPVGVVDVAAEIRTGHISNTCQQRYYFNQHARVRDSLLDTSLPTRGFHHVMHTYSSSSKYGTSLGGSCSQERTFETRTT